jgi:protein-disulfide isomerase
MTYFKIFKLSLLAFFINISTSYADSDIKDKIAFGNKSSSIEVYFVSDWFCPSCKRAEPIIEKLYPQIQSQVAFYFIDYPINKKSLNYSPYNLAFLVHNKPQYFTIRNSLIDLADTVDSPTDENMMVIAEKAQTDLKELSYGEVKSGLDYFGTIVTKYKLNATPTVVVNNTNTHKFVKFSGSNKISEKAILKAIADLNTN